jgi:hypothetical protein
LHGLKHELMNEIIKEWNQAGQISHGAGAGVGEGVDAAAQGRKASMPEGCQMSRTFLNPHLHGVLHLQGGGLQSP